MAKLYAYCTPAQFNLEAKLDKPLTNNSSALQSGFYRHATNSLELETNIRTLATAQTLITAYQMRPTGLAFISNAKQRIFAGCHGNYWIPHLLARQLMTFTSEQPTVFGRKCVQLQYTTTVPATVLNVRDTDAQSIITRYSQHCIMCFTSPEATKAYLGWGFWMSLYFTANYVCTYREKYKLKQAINSFPPYQTINVCPVHAMNTYGGEQHYSSNHS
jgi:hypothetical protein